MHKKVRRRRGRNRALKVGNLVAFGERRGIFRGVEGKQALVAVGNGVVKAVPMANVRKVFREEDDNGS